MNKIDSIKELVELLNQASSAYYNTGNTIMEDNEFDALMDELKSLEQETGFIMSNSPTHNVGAEVVTKLSKVQHERPMLSLDKCHTVQELIDFAGDDDCYLSVKCDGLTTRLIYEDGKLVGAETRGNGEVGQDVLFHVKEYINVPTHIPNTNRYIIDGESVIFYSDFEDINNELPENERFANPRNLASGTLSSLDANITKKRNMRFIAWRVIEGDDNDGHFWRLKNAENLGFDIAPMLTYTSKSSDPDNLEGMLHGLRKQANDIGLPMDGIVVAKNSHTKAESTGRTNKFFRHSIAYKFSDETYETELLDIEWTVGRTGQITPTAVFKPVEIDGSVVERASVHNVSVLTDLALEVGDIIEVYKANMIIPQISRNITAEEKDRNGGVTFINLPTVCPVCGGETKVVTTNNSKVLMCINPACAAKKLAQFVHFVSRNCANIDGLSEKTLKQFISKGYLHTFTDIYHLSEYRNELIRLDGFGVKSIDKLLESIEKSRNIKLENFIAALGIPDVGLSTAKVIANHCNNNIDRFLYLLPRYEWSFLDGIGSMTACKIMDFMQERLEEIGDLILEFNFIEPEKNEVKENPFTGKSLCVTGKLNHFTRNSINEKIVSLGAKAASSVSSKTDYLITNEASGSSKYKKAIELNIPILTEDEFLSMIGE